MFDPLTCLLLTYPAGEESEKSAAETEVKMKSLYRPCSLSQQNEHQTAPLSLLIAVYSGEKKVHCQYFCFTNIIKSSVPYQVLKHNLRCTTKHDRLHNVITYLTGKKKPNCSSSVLKTKLKFWQCADLEQCEKCVLIQSSKEWT